MANYCERNLKKKKQDRQKLIEKHTKVFPKTNHKFLDELKLREGLPQQWLEGDDRQVGWAKERATYGFDEREMWNGFSTLQLFAYERLRWWQEYGLHIIAYDRMGVSIKIYGKKHSFADALQYCIEGLKLDLTLDMCAPSRKLKQNRRKIAICDKLILQLFAHIGW